MFSLMFAWRLNLILDRFLIVKYVTHVSSFIVTIVKEL